MAYRGRKGRPLEGSLPSVTAWVLVILLSAQCLSTAAHSISTLRHGRHLTHGSSSLAIPKHGQHGRDLQQTTGNKLSGLVSKTASSLAGNFADSVGNAALGLAARGLEAIPGPIGQIASTVLGFLGGGTSSGASVQEVQDIVGQAVVDINNHIDQALNNATLQIVSQIRADISTQFTKQAINDAAAALANYQEWLSEQYQPLIPSTSVQDRMTELGNPASSQQTVMKDLTLLMQKMRKLMTDLPSVVPVALPLYTGAAMCHINYLMEYAALSSALRDTTYLRRQELWQLAVTEILQRSADVVELTGGKYDADTTDLLQSWTDLAQYMLDSGYFTVAPNSMPAAGQAPKNVFKWYAHTLAIDVPFTFNPLNLYNPRDLQGGGPLTRTALADILLPNSTSRPPQQPVTTATLDFGISGEPVRLPSTTNPVPGSTPQPAATATECMEKCSASPTCKGFQFIYRKTYPKQLLPCPTDSNQFCYFPFHPNFPNKDLVVDKTCYLTNLNPTQPRTLSEYERQTENGTTHPELVPPGSVLYVAQYTPSTRVVLPGKGAGQPLQLNTPYLAMPDTSGWFSSGWVTSENRDAFVIGESEGTRYLRDLNSTSSGNNCLQACKNKLVDCELAFYSARASAYDKDTTPALNGTCFPTDMVANFSPLPAFVYRARGTSYGCVSGLKATLGQAAFNFTALQVWPTRR